jgi:hypothetical protein
LENRKFEKAKIWKTENLKKPKFGKPKIWGKIA